MRYLIYTILAFFLSSNILIEDSFARSKRKNKSSKRSHSSIKKRSKKLSMNKDDNRFDKIKTAYRKGKISKPQLWKELQYFENSSNKLSNSNDLKLLQLQAIMMKTEGYPILSSLYAVEALKNGKKASYKDTQAAWTLLAETSRNYPIQNLLEQTAQSLKVKSAPPGFGNNWFYYEGNASYADKHYKKALEYYKKIKINDRHFLSARYQMGNIFFAKDDLNNAILSFKTMLNSVSQTLAPISATEQKELSNYAKIALARVFYQQKKFKSAIKFYRSVDRDSTLFYDALFEQSWAFFMGGYPNHALGALHGTESPFFDKVFNPEASVLRAITYYWMCRYEDSRTALADFTDRHSEAVESLSEFLDRKRLRPETAYQLFENYALGVSSSSLGIPKNVLDSASSTESMTLLRNQYAALVEEADKVSSLGIFRQKKNLRATKLLRGQLKTLKKELGSQFIVELKGLKNQFERLYEQSQFLYVELLMSEKEQLLGRELHASSKIDKVSRKKKIIGWGKNNQAWGSNGLNEFWWDEVGFYIYNIQPKCNTH